MWKRSLSKYISFFFLLTMASKPINVRWIRTGFQPYWKIFIALCYRQFFTNIKIKIIKLIPVCCSGFCPLEPNKTCLSILFFNLISAESCLIYDAIKNYSFSFFSRFLTCLIWLTSINFEILSSIHFHLLNSFIQYRNYYKIGILAHTKKCHNSGILRDSCTPPLIINKITSYVHLKYWLKSLDTNWLELLNQDF